MLTVHYVDEHHLLVTFVVHRLIPRLPDEPEDDQDRVVDAVLLELPTGKVLARTTWPPSRPRPIPLEPGPRTLPPPRPRLSHHLRPTRQPLHPRPRSSSIPSSSLPSVASLPSSCRPESDFLIIQSVKRKPPNKHPRTPSLGDTAPPVEDAVQINFYRIRSGDDGGPVQGRSAGVVTAKHTGDVPVTTSGFLAVVDQGKQHWAFDFHSYEGKINELAPFDSSCIPAPLFVSHSEFIAFGCHGGQARHQLAGFNMRGEEMWEQGLFGDFVSPTVAYAPSGGRFALSRVMLHGSAIADQPISNDEVSAQTVVVYQIGTGKQVFRVDCSPVERAGQNFALSSNGLALAVVHAEAIEIYTLPALTPKDQTDIKLAQTSAPPENNLPVHFTPPGPPPPPTVKNPTTPPQANLPLNLPPQPQPPPLRKSLHRNPTRRLHLRRPPPQQKLSQLSTPPQTPEPHPPETLQPTSTARLPLSTPCPAKRHPPIRLLIPKKHPNRNGPATVSRSWPFCQTLFTAKT